MDADGRTDGRAVRKAVFSMIATKRMSTLVGLSPTTQSLGHNIQQYKEESEKEHMDEVRLALPCPFPITIYTRPSFPVQDLNVMHYDGHSEDSGDDSKGQDTPLVKAMDKLAV